MGSLLLFEHLFIGIHLDFVTHLGNVVQWDLGWGQALFLYHIIFVFGYTWSTLAIFDPLMILLYFELCPTLAFWIICSNWCPGLLCPCVLLTDVGLGYVEGKFSHMSTIMLFTTKLVVVITLPLIYSYCCQHLSVRQ